MHIQEIIQTAEENPLLAPESREPFRDDKGDVLNEDVITDIYNFRKRDLEDIRKHICLKLYYFAEEKLNLEKQALMEILNIQQNNQEVMEKYSFVLDPQYFEQKFFKNIK